MHIGFVYDLRDDYIAAGYSPEATAELDSAETIDAIAGTLERLDHRVDRVGSIHRLVERLATGASWDLVFNVAEGLTGYGREAAVPALLDSYGIPYTFSDPLALTTTLHKGVAKDRMRAVGISTAPSAVISDLDELQGLDLPFPVFAKPVAEGTGKGIGNASVARDGLALGKTVGALLTEFGQPVLVERLLEGPEVTVGILGTGERARVAGVLDVAVRAGHVYGYDTKQAWESVVSYRLAAADVAVRAGSLALSAWRALDCRDGGRVDLKSDADGVWHVLEINPLPGLHPTHSDLPILCDLGGISFEQLIDAIVRSARERCDALD